MTALAIWPRNLTASIEDQRTRLPASPPAATCADSVSGIWRAHVYYARLHDWYRYELNITRNANTLSGSIRLRGWNGTLQETEPPPCRPGLRDAEWSEVAAGTVDATNTQIRFEASSYHVEHEYCGSAGGDYALDRFAGTIDLEKQEFVSINTYTFSNGETFSDPTLFRRVSCPAPAGATVQVRPEVTIVPASEAPLAPRRRRLFSCSR